MRIEATLHPSAKWSKSPDTEWCAVSVIQITGANTACSYKPEGHVITTLSKYPASHLDQGSI